MPVSRGMAWKNQLLDFFLILHQNGLDDVDLLAVFNDLLALLIRLFGQFGTFDLNVFCTGDVGEQISAVQLVLNSLLALIGFAGVQIGVAGNSVGEIALIQLLDEVGVDVFAFFSRIDNTGGEEIIDVAAGEHGSTCNSNSGQTCDLQERTTRQNYGSILLKNNFTN